MSILTLASWEGLLRVPSEAIPLEAGEQADAYLLPTTRHSGVWAAKGIAFIRLQQRKHRPRGSLLKRPCRCNQTHRQGCLACRLTKFLPAFKPGQRLWPNTTAYAFMKVMRMVLQGTGKPEAQRITLKTFRASKATHLAKEGKGLCYILELGEWKGKAALHYMNEQALDDDAYLRVTVHQSSDEEPDAPAQNLGDIGGVGAATAPVTSGDKEVVATN